MSFLNSEDWHRVADSAAVEHEAAAEFVIAGKVVAVFRHQGKLYALDAMCAHQGGPIAKGTVEHGCVTCPWHGWQYELATGEQTIHQQKLLETYPTEEADGGIWIKISSEGDT